MPHKIDVMQYCDEIEENARMIGAVNYISCIDGKLVGKNYDGIATLNLIEKHGPVRKKTVVVYGCGGAGLAAVFEAKERGANVIIVNRTHEKAAQAALYFGVQAQVEVPYNFDVFVNATPIGMKEDDSRMIFNAKYNITQRVIFDMASRSGRCLLADKTHEEHGTYISGKEMFIELTLSALNDLCEHAGMPVY